MNIAITKMSSKGQVVIPKDMREDIHDGDKLVLIKTEDQFIIKKAEDFSNNLEEDLEFAKRTAEAYKQLDEGKGIIMEADEFLEEMMKW